MSNKLKVEYIKTGELNPYPNNAKLHPAEQIEQIKRSIEQFGFNDPIAVWKDNEVIEGHGRLLAAKEMALDKVPVIRLDSLNDEERKAYMIAHNKLTMNTSFDTDVLGIELTEIMDKFDFTELGFGDFELSMLTEDFTPEEYDNEMVQKYAEHEDEYLAKKRIIVTYTEEQEQALADMLGLRGIKKVSYDIGELL